MDFHRKPNTFVASAHIKISELERSLAYYQDVIGFQVLEKSKDQAILTADGETPLLTIEQPGNVVPRELNKPGLYHFALLLPNRPQLAAFLQHITDLGIQYGASDPIVSEALYLSDPDGNGIEVYVDRPPSHWRDKHNNIMMATISINRESLLAEKNETWGGLPENTLMGHIHLHVSDLDKAAHFYRDGLGFDIVFKYDQALFMSTGGYHHHIAVNTWNRASDTKPHANSVGLQSYTIQYPSDEDRKKAVENLQTLGISVQKVECFYITEDPSGNRIHLSSAK